MRNCVVFGDVSLGDGVRVEGCLLGKGVNVGGGTVFGERCVLGDLVSVDAGKCVSAGTKGPYLNDVRTRWGEGGPQKADKRNKKSADFCT